MQQSRSCYNFKASSILESVIALSIISVCLFIAVMVYSSVYTQKTGMVNYTSRNKIDEAFFVMQLQADSIMQQYDSESWVIDEVIISTGVKQITVKHRDSIQAYPERKYFVKND